jgi:hypothetical protein
MSVLCVQNKFPVADSYQETSHSAYWSLSSSKIAKSILNRYSIRIKNTSPPQTLSPINSNVIVIFWRRKFLQMRLVRNVMLCAKTFGFFPDPVEERRVAEQILNLLQYFLKNTCSLLPKSRDIHPVSSPQSLFPGWMKEIRWGTRDGRCGCVIGRYWAHGLALPLVRSKLFARFWLPSVLHHGV